MPDAPDPLHRPHCYRCQRPAQMCLCADLPVVPTRTRVVVLQHPKEQRHPFGTARFLRLCLPNAAVHTAYGGWSGDLHTPLEVPPDTVLLYPHPAAEDLGTLAATERPSTLLLLDGTWAHARRLYRMNPWLQRLRHVRFQPRVPSRYRIRREPRADYVSTVEATVEALQQIEPETLGLDQLVAVFERMVDRQVEHLNRVRRADRCRRPRQRPSRRIPAEIRDPSLVLGYAESSLPGGDPRAERQIVQWVAVRAGPSHTGAVSADDCFEVLVRPAAHLPWPDSCHLAHMGIRTEELAAGCDLPTARAQFASWAADRARVAAWTSGTLDWAAPLLGEAPPTLVLKPLYSNVRQVRPGFLEQVLAREGLTTVPVPCRGRARERLGNALAVLRWLQREHLRLAEAP